MNGPFFSERGIVSPYSSTRRSFTHCARRIFRNPRTGPETRCESGQKGHTKRVPCAFGIFSTITAHPALAKPEQNLRRGRELRNGFHHRLRCTAAELLSAVRVVRAGVRSPSMRRRDVLLAVIRLLSISRRAGFIFTAPPKQFSRFTTACAVRRSSDRSDAFCASSRPESEIPTEFAGDCPSRGLHRRRAGDPPDSSPRRAPWDAFRATACGPLFRTSHFRDPDCRAGQSWPCNPR